ncbi:MAG: hypothetical protein JW820_18915, partial [Spirochaetales bacterium]|nr:hypothetical protein [Spirochaetales bacterium]
MKRRSLAFAVLALVLAATVGFAAPTQEAEEEITFAYMSGILDPFMQMIEKGMRAKAEELGVNVLTAEYPKAWGPEVQVPIL